MADARGYLENKLPAYLDLLAQMVSINSFTANPQGVNQLGQLTFQLFESLGFQAEFIQSANSNYGKHLFLTRPGSRSLQERRMIALVSHLDTVFPPEEEKQNRFSWRIESSRIYGPGTLDIKGGTIVAWMVLEAMERFYNKTFESLDWLVAFDASEETLSHDFSDQLYQRLKPDPMACLIFEGGYTAGDDYPLVIARKGRATFRIKVEGRAAHAGNRHAQGANAIVQLAKTVQSVADMTDYNLQLTFNVGTIRGGSVVNRVPHFAEAEVEMRAFSPQVFQSGVECISVLDGAAQVSSSDGYPCKVSIQLLDQTAPWPHNPGTEWLFSLWQEAGRDLNLSVIPEERSGLSDGNFLWMRYPTLDGLGPVGDNAHCSERNDDGSKDQEYALETSFVPKAMMSLIAIERMVSQK